MKLYLTNKEDHTVPGPVLEFYDAHKPVTLQVDASKTGIGAVVLQDGKPVAYASKALTGTQEAYTQIESSPLRVQRMTVTYKPEL